MLIKNLEKIQKTAFSKINSVLNLKPAAGEFFVGQNVWKLRKTAKRYHENDTLWILYIFQ